MYNIFQITKGANDKTTAHDSASLVVSYLWVWAKLLMVLIKRRVDRAVDKTRNMEHFGTSRNMENYLKIMRKMCKIK